MVAHKTEETLHIYLRRHFERIAKGTARQFAEQKEAAKVNVVPDARPADAQIEAAAASRLLPQ